MPLRTPTHGGKHSPRAKDETGAAARTRILDAAEQLFAKQGFDGTPTSHIARDAGVPKGLLFYYFPAKFALLTALLEERFQGEKIDSEPLAVPGDPVLGLVRIAERYTADQARSTMLRVVVWREQHTHLEVADALAHYLENLEQSIEQLLATSVSSPVDQRILQTTSRLWASYLTTRPLPGASTGGPRSGSELRLAAGLVYSGMISEL
ncbi:TetR/AcrR family transcriptional regulator [Glutamicibacter arilaitensis]|uniref:TetR/AcrR family transcriptional regulator n=1 Tax=Glutamicibacter arilaitensis TaxID=256701 RepID=UPI00384B4B88